MTDLISLKLFVVRLYKNLTHRDLLKFGNQLFDFCSNKNIEITHDLQRVSDYFDLMKFAFDRELITTQNTDLISQLIYESERYEFNEELFYLEKSFNKQEEMHHCCISPHDLSSSYTCDSTVTFVTEYEHATKETDKVKSQTKSHTNKLTRKRVRDTEYTEPAPHKKIRDDNTMLTDIETMKFCTQIIPDEWKPLAVVGFKMTLILVERIDYDEKTIQDKTLKMFTEWKNLSFGSSVHPPYTKYGLRQAALDAKLNGLIDRLQLEW